MSRCPVIITPKMIRRHNLRCVGRIFLWTLGSLSVFLVAFLFAWVLATLFTGERQLTLPIFLFSMAVAVGVFVLGHRYLRKNGPQDWERIAQKSEVRSGMKLSRLSHQEYGRIGHGFCALVLAGPDWLGRVVDEGRAMFAATEESAKHLENLRQHFAAREGWVPMRDFEQYESEIYQLAKLEILSIRELLGEWHLHVTVKGTFQRETGGEVEESSQ